ncbi:S8 family serine peptidase [Shewanella fidelis]|uniref:S8 family serine peptidase n=1 Tax=Shewanella fidelis TaxID=173509 RepID=UPI00048D246E|nr:S8 family serine peptidase [Shewanella fidelis]
MKVKVIVTAVAAALYSAGLVQAAVNHKSVSHQLQPLKVTTEEIHKYNNELLEIKSMLQNDGLNVQINPQANKFNAEDDLVGEHIYLVRLMEQPVTVVANNKNSIIAHALTSKNSNKLFVNGRASVNEITRYEEALKLTQRAVINEISSLGVKGQARKQFTRALNGFSISLTQDEAQTIAGLASVAQVMRLKEYKLLSDQGPQQIDADKVWNGAASDSGVGYKGEGQIVGIIDTGINSDHRSFSDIGDDGYDHENPFGSGVYVGDCVEERDLVTCNDKLIGIRSYPDITENFAIMRPGWPEIGEDYNGHGSHVASTAAGNVLHNVPFVVPAAGENSDGEIVKNDLFPLLSGVAPHSNIISYQVCNADNDQGFTGCPGEALVAGIEDAITDGVDVINFSIGGADSNVWGDPVQLAFLSAREAGINVAAAAGNDGTKVCGASECFGYLDNASPWLAQVAATTHSREVAIDTKVEYAGFIDPALGSEQPSWIDSGVSGGSMNIAEITGVVVWAKDYADENGNKDYNGYCETPYPAGSFDFFKDGTPIPGAENGDTNVFVVCQRHAPDDPEANARTAKVANIKAGGADGFVMFNRVQSQNTPVTQYELPSVHFTNEQWNGSYFGANDPNNTDGLADWIDSASELGHMITIKSTVVERNLNEEDADWLADFSSRGPSFSNREVLAPAMAAPGVDIYAAYSDEKPFTSSPFAADFILMSGTSMASPHVAGALALLRQGHPEWSATEVQSALSMTADNVVKYHRLNNPTDKEGLAEVYRAGSGRINVAKALKAGFVMDENVENFMAADPNNGGVPHKLNMPNLVDFECKPQCQWIRTIKATKDATWSASSTKAKVWSYDMNGQLEQNGGINIEVIPSEFTLKAGETQTIVVKASVDETKDIFSNGEAEFHANILFEADDQDIPLAHWPIVFQNDNGDLPRNLNIVAHENRDSYRLQQMVMPEAEAPIGTTYTAVKANYETFTVIRDDDRVFPWKKSGKGEDADSDILDEATHVIWVDVPENAKRFIMHSEGLIASEFEGTFDAGNTSLYVGKDYNGNGVADPYEEILCVSNHIALNNYCDFTDPEPGKYWAIFYDSYNAKATGTEETFAASYGVVLNDVDTGISVNIPSSDGVTPIDVDFAWELPMEKGDIFYSMLDIGSSAVNQGNIGHIPLRIERGEDKVSLDVPQTAAKSGDIIPYTFQVLANNSGADREFVIEATFPESIKLSDENIFASSDNVESIVVEGDKLMISGVQPDTSMTAPDYNITTNVDDLMCRTPDVGNANPGGYISLKEFGISPLFSGFDERGNVTYRKGTVIPTSVMFNGNYSNYQLYNNNETSGLNQSLLSIHGNGWIDLQGGGTFFPQYYRLPFEGFPHSIIAPIWRGWSYDGADRSSVFSVGLNHDTGVSLASTASGVGIIDFGNAKDYQYSMASRSFEPLDNNIDYQVIFNVNTSFVQGEYELFMAYKDIDWGTRDGRGVVGLKGFKGPNSTYGPLIGGYLGTEYAFENLDTQLTEDLVVCYDYVGPESSQFEVTAWIQLGAATAGQDLTVNAISKVEGMADIEMSHALEVSSNITLGAFDDMIVDEDGSIDIQILFVDEKNTANKITATGENVEFTVNGHEAGAILTLSPVKDFDGETLVTITVADIDNPSDAASQSFMLTVLSDGIDENTGAEIEPEKPASNKGGAIGVFLLLLAVPLLVRRKLSVQ